jgi:ascorbate-specific PTS system EIIC-type component UlaA
VRNARRHGTAAISMLLVLLGLAVVARSIQAGVGGGLGLIIGVMLVAAGALRLYLATRT